MTDRWDDSLVDPPLSEQNRRRGHTPMSESTDLHYCGGYGCDNPAPIEVLAGHSGGTLGWLCEDCADEAEREWERDAAKNKSRIEARGGFDV